MKLKFSEVKEKSNYSICIVDNIAGTYLPIAHRLSDFFETVYYYSVNQTPFPKASMDAIGKGYNNIIRVDEFWNNLSSFDIIVFPDIYFNDWGYQLRQMGKMVFGGCDSDILENDRKLFRNLLESVDLPVADCKIVIGIDSLIEYLSTCDNKWVKLSYYRGEMETFKHINIKQSEVFLNELKHQMGPLANTIEFIVEDNIDSIAEIGYDGWTINGENPENMIWGLEVKNCSYIGKASNINEMPSEIKIINDKFKPILKKYNQTSFYSTEIRVSEDKKPYYTDICARAGAPPSCTYLQMIDNWDEIIIGGCNGEIVEPIFSAKYGVELILKSSYSNFLPVSFPEGYRKNIKLKSSFMMNGKDYIVPFKDGGFIMETFGSVVVVGDDLDECMNKALEIANSIDAYGLSYDENALNKGRESLMRIEQALGVKF